MNNDQSVMPDPTTRPEDDPYSVGRKERLPAQAGGAPVTPAALEPALAKLRARAAHEGPECYAPNAMLDTAEAAALLDELQRRQWRSMDSAPKDGRWLMLGSRTSCFMGFWCSMDSHWKDQREALRDPTGWMPLPEPPK